MRWATRAAVAIGFVVGVVLFMPWTCWEAECPAAEVDCRSSGCDNALGMTFDGRSPGIGLLGGMAVAAVVLAIIVAVSRFRSSTRRTFRL